MAYPVLEPPLVREHGAFRVQQEAGRLHLLADGGRREKRRVQSPSPG
jgi:hypothetical protein